MIVEREKWFLHWLTIRLFTFVHSMVLVHRHFSYLWFYDFIFIFSFLLYILWLNLLCFLLLLLVIICYRACLVPHQKTVFSSTNQNWIQKKISHLIINVKWKIIIVLFWTIWVHPLLVFYICYLWFNCDVIDSFFLA